MTVADDLRQAWTALRAQPDTGIRLLPLGIATKAGAIAAGVDKIGCPHLLVPVDPGTNVTADCRSKAVTVARRVLVVEGKRRVFVDVACLMPDLADVFERFSAQVCERIEREPSRAPTLPAAVLATWRRLLEGGSGPSQEALVGLFGELLVLEAMVQADPSSRVDHWQVGAQAVHDFVRAGQAVEVKTTTVREGRRVEIHGIDQLAPPEGGSLHLVFLRLQVGDEGRSVGDLVKAVRSATYDQDHLDSTLRTLGWIEDGAAPPRFKVVEQRWYRVDQAFPHLTKDVFVGSEVPEGVMSIRYSIDLSGAVPRPLSDSEQGEVLRMVATS